MEKLTGKEAVQEFTTLTLKNNRIRVYVHGSPRGFGIDETTTTDQLAEIVDEIQRMVENYSECTVPYLSIMNHLKTLKNHMVVRAGMDQVLSEASNA